MLSACKVRTALGPARRVVLSSRRGCQARAEQQQKEENREMPQGVDFQYENTDEIPEPDLWEGEQWEVCHPGYESPFSFRV